jgi:hypothetical protein
VRLKLEIAGGIALALILGLYVYEQFQKSVQVKVAEVVAQHDREADAKLDQRMKALESADSQRQKDYEAKSASLQKQTPQQIVVKLPEYVPQAKEPVTIVPPDYKFSSEGGAVDTTHLHPGDAIVPQSDIKPIAQALLDGNKCAGDLAACGVQKDVWKQKYDVKTDEADRWQTAAKGGSIWKRVAKDILKIGVGVGVGYALPH